ncbi:V-type proton ATPase subunit A [Fusarium oxysporum f. sp. lycopersici 4287]|uniref:V-type proton ATPase subunit a n=3 Tax=Fusarium oxysporum TaxID=5507 RepID=A0A0J9W8C1_FUSO4|nr:V-type proton ATPase subunit A [Fusarium oxysporum f. sp. lycopersici 4287]XP_018256856.1 V-type proton ATPase subunit A [Fusarium oxysporum f. sp. lycopersici 4287]KAJ9419098.1 V-type proton ATPase [Fusarium oxysporum]KNB04856.1 V-type proton ATPase subunit A [Fusarium oxysporum f. sp. lycopersici 4287]KNB18811.1 V-type proton ATPase subunit A [Fusarium oxysporum f. sp. lycopersici 4287]
MPPMSQKDTFFRSADMSLVQLYISHEIDREVVIALGELGLCEFRDVSLHAYAISMKTTYVSSQLNNDVSSFRRPFTQEVRRLHNVERQLRYFHGQIIKAGIRFRIFDLDNKTPAQPSTPEIDQLVERSEKLERRISALSDSYEALKERERNFTEWRCVLREAGSVLDHTSANLEQIRASTHNNDTPLSSGIQQYRTASHVERGISSMRVDFVGGVISRDRAAAFERILWRTLRGNLYMEQSEIPDPITDSTNEVIGKNVFLILTRGNEIMAKVRKIAEAMGAKVYKIDESSDLRRNQLHIVNSRLEDVQSVLQNTQATLEEELNQISQFLSVWMVLIAKEKAVYATLNLFACDPGHWARIAECWCPTNNLHFIRTTLQDVACRAGVPVPSTVSKIRTNERPPTYLKTNKFTEGFQTIVNAYGTATYQEVNPALSVIVTFPFLFAVMFGDFGHALILVFAALAMIHWETPLKKVTFELFAIIFFGRYITLVMAVFSLFTGLIYNEAFSRSMPIFDSAWTFRKPESWPEKRVISGTLNDHGYHYPFGLDWAWHGTENELLFSNSYKMKMSIILGWAHMTYSLCFSYLNASHLKKPIDIWGNFIPRMIFFQVFVGYIVFCIVYKWSVDWLGTGAQPPSLLNMLIKMVLQPGTVDERLYAGQEYVQVILLLISFAQIPILLFLKPFFLWWNHNYRRCQAYRGIGETSRVSVLDSGDENEALVSRHGDSVGDDGESVMASTQDIDEDHDEFKLGEVMIQQIIHTVEFCLNCVSHTASYLRLWALSLAHRQLSVVLWNMTLGHALSMEGALGVIMVVVSFCVWFCLTIAILVCMEGTSAMLHSLRLVWVESFSKFAEFGGWPFAPFSFNDLLKESEELKDYVQ